MYQNDAQKVLTGEVRLSYAYIVAPRAPKNNPDGKKKYSVTLLIPKSDVGTKADIDKSIEAAVQQAVEKTWKVRPPVIAEIVHDGDGVRRNGMPYGPECKGHWVLTASRDTQPYLCDIKNTQVDLPAQEFYSGCYTRALIRFYGYDKAGNRGIGCDLRGLIKTRDGEPLTGGVVTAAEFEGIGLDDNSAGGVNPITGMPW